MALFADLAALSDTLAAEAGRLKKRAAIAAALEKVVGLEAAEARHSGQPYSLQLEAVADAGLFCLYLAGQPFAEADSRKLNAGGALLTRALKEVSGCTDAALSAAYRLHGDLGAAAFDLLAGQKPAVAEGLMLEDVAEVFAAMAVARTTAARFALVEGLLRRANPQEAKYLLKLMLGDMRIGVKQSLLEEAIAVAASHSGAGVEVADVRHAVMLEADLARAAAMAFTGTLSEARMRLFHPLGFMLASPVETPDEAVARFTEKPPKLEKTKKPAKRKKPQKKKGEQASEAFEDLGEGQGIEPRDAAAEGLAEDVEITAGEADASPAMQKDGEPVQAFLEDKYDGMRAQLHCGDPAQPGRVVVYSRNREDITESYPEIVEAFEHVKETVGGLILDGELLGWDLGQDGSAEKALPFAVLGQRIGRKRVSNEMRRQIPVVFMAFDLLYERGELLLPVPLRERRARLEAVVERLQTVTHSPLERDEHADHAQAALFAASSASGEGVQRLRLSPAKLVESAEAIDRAYADARERANEGVMLKAVGSAYLPGRRGLAWVKLKRELATLDVVITGAEFGHGRRAGLLSDYTFAVRGADGGLLNVGKAYSGVTDAEIAELTEWLMAHTLEEHGHFRTVEPLRVLEVAFNNVMRSDRHASGFALRFPRILRIRDDKPLDEIDTLERVEEIYQSQPDKGGE